MTNQDFNTLYMAYKNLVYNLALGYLQNTTDAEDVTQEVFIKIHQNFHRYNSVSASLKTWIYRITINHCLDFIKIKKTKRRFGFIVDLFDPNSNEPIQELASFSHPGIQLEDKESLSMLFYLINKLPDNQKTALILTKIEDRSHKETAEIMNINIKAVESLLHRAKQNLKRNLLANEGF